MRQKRAQRIGKLRIESRAAHTCKAEVALIADYLANELSPNIAAAFDHHLSTCSDCAAFLRTYKKTIEMTRAFLSAESRQNQSRMPFIAR